MARCTSFIYCTTISCHATLVLVGLLDLAGTLAAYIILLGSSRVTHGMKIMDLSASTLLLPVGFFFLVGVILLAVGILGLWKARAIEKKPKYMLFIAGFLLFVGIVLTVVVLLSVNYVELVEERLDSKMQTTFTVAAADSGSEERQDWDNVQTSFTCCGISSAFSWLVAYNSLDYSTVPESCGNSESEKRARPGCKAEVQDNIVGITYIACGILALIAGVMLIVIIMLVAVGIKSIRNPNWMRLQNEVGDEDESDDSFLEREKSVTDIVKGMPANNAAQPVSAREVRLQNRRVIDSDNKKANVVVVS